MGVTKASKTRNKQSSDSQNYSVNNREELKSEKIRKIVKPNKAIKIKIKYKRKSKSTIKIK